MIFDSGNQSNLNRSLHLEYLFKQSCQIFSCQINCQIYIYQFFKSTRFSGSQEVFYFLKRSSYLATLLTNTLLTYKDFHQRKSVFQCKAVLDLHSPHFPSWHSCMLPGLSLRPVSTVFQKGTSMPWAGTHSLSGYFRYLYSELPLLFLERIYQLSVLYYVPARI